MTQRFSNMDVEIPPNMARRIIFHAYALQSDTRDGLASVFARSAGFVYHFGSRGKYPGRIGFQDAANGRVWSLDYPLFDSVKVDYTSDVTLIVPQPLKEIIRTKRLHPGKSHGFCYNMDIDADWYTVMRRNNRTGPHVMDTAFKYYEAFWWHTRLGRTFFDREPDFSLRDADEQMLSALIYEKK